MLTVLFCFQDIQSFVSKFLVMWENGLIRKQNWKTNDYDTHIAQNLIMYSESDNEI